MMSEIRREFLGRRWTKEDLIVLNNVLDIGIDASTLSKDEREMLLKTSANLREIVK